MILEFDIGNTRAKWRMLSGSENLNPVEGQSAHLSEVVSRGVIEDEHWETIQPIVDRAEMIRFSSVANTQLLAYLKTQAKFEKSIFQAHSSAYCAGVSNSYKDPQRLGVDRWLAMVAAYNKQNKACCVIDCGSAVTADFVTTDGQHVGGYIVAGLQMLERTLLKDTDKIFIRDDAKKYDIQWGTSTEEAVRHGKISLLSAWINQLAENSFAEHASVYITGGDAQVLKPYLSPRIEYVEDLVFEGLPYVCEKPLE